MTYQHLAIMAVFTLFYSLFTGWIQRMPISGPIIFTVFGLAVGPLGLGLFDPGIDHEGRRFLAELTPGH